MATELQDALDRWDKWGENSPLFVDAARRVANPDYETGLRAQLRHEGEFPYVVEDEKWKQFKADDPPMYQELLGEFIAGVDAALGITTEDTE